MLKLNTKSLQSFFSRASKIQKSSQLPVLSYLKLSFDNEIATLIKSNLEATIIGQVEYEGDPVDILIDENDLSISASNCQSEFIEVEHINNVGKLEVVLRYNKVKKVTPSEDINTYPVIPEIKESDIIKLTSDHLSAIEKASSFTGESEALSFVQITPAAIAAFSQQSFYINTSFNDLPTILLRPDEIKMLPNNEVEFSDLERHHVFYTPGFTYIFTKVEGKAAPIDTVLERLRQPGKDFSFDPAELISFCNEANATSKSQIATCTMNGGNLSLNDAAYSRSIDAEYACEGQPDEFTFNSRLVLSGIKALPTGKIGAKTNQNCLIINDNQEWYCFIGMSK
jgi:hypothetical protein